MSPRRRADDSSLVPEQRPNKYLRTTAPSPSSNDVVTIQVAGPSTSHSSTDVVAIQVAGPRTGRGKANLQKRSLVGDNRSPGSLWDVYKSQWYSLPYKPLSTTPAAARDSYLRITRLANFPEHGDEDQRKQAPEKADSPPSFFKMRGTPPRGWGYQAQIGDRAMDREDMPMLRMPSGFGSNYSKPLSSSDIYLEEFFEKAFCPGRTIKPKNNVWLQHIMPIQDIETVVLSRRCLSALYVNDLTVEKSLENRQMKNIIERDEMRIFERLKDIQKQCGTVLPDKTAVELLAICPVLIQLDIVNFDREKVVALPQKPLRTYLVDFVIELLRTGRIDVGGPHVLTAESQPQAMPTVQHGDSIAKESENCQWSPFKLHSTLMIARHSILAQPMEDLRSKHFDARREQNKFDWLLRVSSSEASQIDPRLGFSRMLLFYIHSITYLAHGMIAGPEWRWPKTALTYLEALNDMKQWSKEYTTELTAKNNSQPIERIRLLDADYKTESPAEMTSWTAEAWRLAVIAYCQCRLLRLPRNHPDVVATLEDLHHCIRVQPTEGDLFTTEAPLYPVFLLGLLSSPQNPHHRATSQTWMVNVTSNSERNTARPLREALDKIWGWIDQHQDFTPSEPSALHSHIWERRPWWEHLAHEISKEQGRLLCLT